MKIGLFIDEDAGRNRVIAGIKSLYKSYKPRYVEDVCVSDKLLDNDGFDLVIIDYGGLTSYPGNSLGECYARYVNKYAEDHPNTLIIYISVMSKEWLERDGLDFDKLHNIKYSNIAGSISLWKKWRDLKC